MNLGLMNGAISGLGAGDFHNQYSGGLCGDNTGIISNCYAVVGVSSSDGSDYAGGLCGDNSGIIVDCYASGDVDGESISVAGGLCGRNTGNIIRSFSTGSLRSGFSYNDGETIRFARTGGSLGGLCGGNSGTIIDCYATGRVEGDRNVGGLCGTHSEGILRNSFASGLVLYASNSGGLIAYRTGSSPGTVENCFWDINTSSTTWSAGGTGKTTAEMQTLSTFTNAGWDFVDETANGQADVWAMKGYPVLAWQLPSLPPVFGLVVENGSGDGDYMEDTVVQISADAAEAGYRFVGWATAPVTYTNNLADVSSSSTMFTMPGTNVTLIATYYQWDSDLDGMDDDWEQQIVDAILDDGINSVFDVLPGDDFDGDGVSNGDEYTLNRDPVVIEAMIANLSVAQRPGTKTIDITYDLISGSTNALSVSLAVSNGVAAVPVFALTGDIGNSVSTGVVKVIEWAAGDDWDGNQAELDFAVKADGVLAAEQVAVGSLDTRDYTLTVSADHGNPSPAVGIHSNYCWYSSVTCSVETVTGDGWLFMGWLGDATTDYSQTNVTVQMDALTKSVTALFSDDADGDGLKNTNEWAVGSNPRMADTDGDHFGDAFEVAKGWNPTNCYRPN